MTKSKKEELLDKFRLGVRPRATSTKAATRAIASETHEKEMNDMVSTGGGENAKPERLSRELSVTLNTRGEKKEGKDGELLAGEHGAVKTKLLSSGEDKVKKIGGEEMNWKGVRINEGEECAKEGRGKQCGEKAYEKREGVLVVEGGVSEEKKLGEQRGGERER